MSDSECNGERSEELQKQQSKRSEIVTSEKVCGTEAMVGGSLQNP